MFTEQFPGTSEQCSLDAYKLACTQKGILYSTAGVHPHDAKGFTDKTLHTLRELAKHPEVSKFLEFQNFAFRIQQLVHKRWLPLGNVASITTETFLQGQNRGRWVASISDTNFLSTIDSIT